MQNSHFIKFRTISTFMFNLTCLFAVIFSALTYAGHSPKPVIDMFRTDQITLKTIHEKFAVNFQSMANIMQSPASMTSTENMKEYTDLFKETISGINQLGNFSMVSISPIMYPGDKTTYFTIDIVDKADKKRMSYFTAPAMANLPDPDHLIQSWQDYEKIGFNKFFKQKIAPVVKSCPAFHCAFGFDSPELAKYKDIFMTGVPKNKDRLIAVLKHDKDENKRATAAYLLAHIHDGNELITILVPSMRDPSSGVRNNVMRVLAETMAKNTKTDFPVQEAITALDFPMVTDRNKAMYIIVSLIKQPRYAKYISQHAQTQLIEELKMRQLDLHNLAYSILVQISGKNYGERNYTAWKNWLDKNSKAVG